MTYQSWNNGGFRGIQKTRDPATGTPGIWSLEEMRSYNRTVPDADPNWGSVVLLARFQKEDWIHRGALTSSGSGLRDLSTAGNMLMPVCTFASAVRYGVGLSPKNTKWGFPISTLCNPNGGCFGWGTAGTTITLGTGDFTIEGWWMFDGSIASTNFVDCRTGSGAEARPTIYIVTSGTSTIRYFQSGADRITGATLITSGAWNHIALSRVSGNTYLYLNGVQQGATYVDATNYLAMQFFTGGPNIAGSATQIWIQEVRVTNGVGRYSGATCTVPTGPFPTHG